MIHDAIHNDLSLDPIFYQADDLSASGLAGNRIQQSADRCGPTLAVLVVAIAAVVPGQLFTLNIVLLKFWVTGLAV